MLYANSPIPLYRQLYYQLREAIEDGELEVGNRLPSERQLAAEYGISRLTARKAVTLLRKEGYVRAHQGRGSFVA
ncbi:MAG: GntR family transcriptional regulator [Anaerolineae bacterium]